MLGDKFGIYHAHSRPQASLAESFVAVPIGPRLGADATIIPAAISFQFPNSVRRYPYVTDPVNVEKTLDSIEAALFPSDRERPVYDFVPRWWPEQWVDVDTAGVGGASGRGMQVDGEGVAVRFRAVGVSPDGNAMVAVGDRGALAVWRRVETEQE